MSEIKTVKKASEIPKEKLAKKPEDEEEFEGIAEEKLEEEEQEEPEGIEEYAEVIEATEKADKVKVLFEVDRKTAKKLTELCVILDKTKREFIQEALEKHIAFYEDLSYLDGFNLSDPYVKVDEFIAYLKARKVTVLMPKALKRIKENLEPKWAISLGCNKWVEFCRKLGLDSEEAGKAKVAYYVEWK